MKYIFFILCLYSFITYASPCTDIIKKLSTSFQKLKTFTSNKQLHGVKSSSEGSTVIKPISINSPYDIMDIIFPTPEKQDPQPISVLIKYGSKPYLDQSSIFMGDDSFTSGHIKVINHSGSVRGFVHFDIGPSDINSFTSFDGKERLFERVDNGLVTGMTFDDSGKVVDLMPSLERFTPISINIQHSSLSDFHLIITIASLQGEYGWSLEMVFSDQGYMLKRDIRKYRADGSYSSTRYGEVTRF